MICLSGPRGAGKQLNLGDGHGGVANDADGASAGAGLERGRDLANGRGWQREQMRVGFALIGLPSELLDHAGQDAIGLPHVPGIVKAPDDQVMFTNVGEFLREDGISGERRLIIKMVIESRLVRNDEVLTRGDRLFQDGVSIHKGSDDAGNHGSRVASLQCIDGIGRGRGAGGRDDALHDLCRGESLAGALRCG